MKLFEYEAKNILKQYGILIPKGYIARSPEEAEAVAQKIGKPVALKSQVLVSGRRLSGGIEFADNPTEARQVASKLIGSTIKGHTVGSLLVEEKLDIVKRSYASVTIDRQAKTYIVLASHSGGIDIEEIVQNDPSSISRYWVDPGEGFNTADAMEMVSRFSIGENEKSNFASALSTLYRVAIDYDTELVEVNPLCQMTTGQYVAADARLILDDNALFRHPEFKYNRTERVNDTPREAEARRQNLAYVDLDGDIGIIGNGAGLVMSTIDLVQFFGGRPANFLDIGGGAQTDTIKRSVVLVMSKPEVRAVLMNIVGGITRCDIVAQGIIEGLNDSSVKKPVVVRMMGTNEAEGVGILYQAGIHTYRNIEEALAEVLKL